MMILCNKIRDNLDPFQLNDDLKIWDALAKCQVEDEVKAMGGLDIHVKESGTSFSLGQRQLLCLARAFLKSSKVIMKNNYAGYAMKDRITNTHAHTQWKSYDFLLWGEQNLLSKMFRNKYIMQPII